MHLFQKEEMERYLRDIKDKEKRKHAPIQKTKIRQNNLGKNF